MSKIKKIKTLFIDKNDNLIDRNPHSKCPTQKICLKGAKAVTFKKHPQDWKAIVNILILDNALFGTNSISIAANDCETTELIEPKARKGDYIFIILHIDSQTTSSKEKAAKQIILMAKMIVVEN
ncbi:MAG: hypothetical protein ABI550_04595 [Ignavibacteriaceae bacterium]